MTIIYSGFMRVWMRTIS